MDDIAEILRLLRDAPPDIQVTLLAHLRRKHPIHALEADWGVPAEVILGAIARSSALSQRGVRGLIAEAYFEAHALPTVPDWVDDTPPGNHAYDFRLRKGDATARIQVKTQRMKKGELMLAGEKYVVETQRTRRGTDRSGADTRPYRFGEFDILAVNLRPGTKDWGRFHYTLERWLLPREDAPHLMAKFQPVARDPDDDWTDDLGTSLRWLEEGVQKRIRP